jgi:hypothetical protein
MRSIYTVEIEAGCGSCAVEKSRGLPELIGGPSWEVFEGGIYVYVYVCLLVGLNLASRIVFIRRLTNSVV